MRQASSLCAYGELTDELTRDKFRFGLNEDHTRTDLLKTHVKPDNTKKTMHDVVAEARAIESAKQTNKLIVDSSKGTDEEVHWTGLRYSQMKLRREPGTCLWCGYWRGAHPWRVCPAKGKRPVRLAVAMIILPVFVWKILRLQYQIPDSKLPTQDMVGRPRMDNDVTHNRVASGMTHEQIHPVTRPSLHRHVCHRGAAI